MLSNVDKLFINTRSHIEPQDLVAPKGSQIQDPDADKVHITLKQIVRDWTDLGAEERDQSYKLILNEIMDQFSEVNIQQEQVKVVINYY